MWVNRRYWWTGGKSKRLFEERAAFGLRAGQSVSQKQPDQTESWAKLNTSGLQSGTEKQSWLHTVSVRTQNTLCQALRPPFFPFIIISGERCCQIEERPPEIHHNRSYNVIPVRTSCSEESPAHHLVLTEFSAHPQSWSPIQKPFLTKLFSAYMAAFTYPNEYVKSIDLGRPSPPATFVGESWGNWRFDLIPIQSLEYNELHLKENCDLSWFIWIYFLSNLIFHYLSW